MGPGSTLTALCLVFREDVHGPDNFDWMSPTILIGRLLNNSPWSRKCLIYLLLDYGPGVA
jgi:hypothetical protein